MLKEFTWYINCFVVNGKSDYKLLKDLVQKSNKNYIFLTFEKRDSDHHIIK